MPFPVTDTSGELEDPRSLGGTEEFSGKDVMLLLDSIFGSGPSAFQSGTSEVLGTELGPSIGATGPPAVPTGIQQSVPSPGIEPQNPRDQLLIQETPTDTGSGAPQGIEEAIGALLSVDEGQPTGPASQQRSINAPSAPPGRELDPLAGDIEAFRDANLGVGTPPQGGLDANEDALKQAIIQMLMSRSGQTTNPFGTQPFGGPLGGS